MTTTPVTPDTEAKVDRLVEELVPDDATAEKLKDALHKTLHEHETQFVEPGDAQDTEQKGDDSGDDLWDNIPV